MAAQSKRGGMCASALLDREVECDRVLRASDALLSALYILSSPRVTLVAREQHADLYIEEMVLAVAYFAQWQLSRTVFPAFDNLYRLKMQSMSQAICALLTFSPSPH